MHLQELGIATLTSCFLNANRDPKKGEAAKPSDFFYFLPQDNDNVRISTVVANTFFALADAGLLPAACVAIAPIEKLNASRDSTPVRDKRALVGSGVVLISPSIDEGVVRFPLGLVEDVSGRIQVKDVTTGEELVIEVSEMTSSWVLDGEVAIV